MNDNCRIRFFVSSTFRDMMGERDELMTHAWPELRLFCREWQVELVEVDLRWGNSAPLQSQAAWITLRRCYRGLISDDSDSFPLVIRRPNWYQRRKSAEHSVNESNCQDQDEG